jgi:cyclopropane fatty-acyl-phospholipid synthase-like methyltransferase
MSVAVAPACQFTVHNLPAPRVPNSVAQCYNVLDLCRGCGITDFTEGKYIDDANDRPAYLAAQRRQTSYLLDQVDCGPGSRILDIGCGYGRLLAAATARRAIATGITVSPLQAGDCHGRSLDARLLNYRELCAGGDYADWTHAFDGLVANGSLEHFVQCEDAAAGRADAIYTEFFEICHRLLRAGGRLVTTAIHARSVGQVDAAELVKGPDAWPKGSLNYHAANLHRSFGGWHPEPGQLERCAEGLFELTAAEDGTHDYLLTSEYWIRQIKRSLALDPRSWALAVPTFIRQPRATWRMLHCLLWAESWNYQFRDPAPVQLWRHTWQAV